MTAEVEFVNVFSCHLHVAASEKALREVLFFLCTEQPTYCCYWHASDLLVVVIHFRAQFYFHFAPGFCYCCWLQSSCPMSQPPQAESFIGPSAWRITAQQYCFFLPVEFWCVCFFTQLGIYSTLVETAVWITCIICSFCFCLQRCICWNLPLAKVVIRKYTSLQNASKHLMITA